uniref:Uncharacterized protein n=1 Tax=Anguilla anguilla TaxID=7936 RepID=A0A0E9XX57_ANGAN
MSDSFKTCICLVYFKIFLFFLSILRSLMLS